jgi:hypothetical protein
MKKLLFTCLLIITTCLYAVPKPLLLEGEVDGYYFRLINDKPHCQLSIKKANKTIQTVLLSCQSPCYFFADNQQEKIQSYSYPDNKLDYVLLIGGTAAELSAEERQLKKLPGDSYCTQESQAITLEDGKVKIGMLNSKAFACAEDRLDEKVYQQVLTQQRRSIKTVIEQQTAISNRQQSNASKASFLENIQQKLEVIFK